MKTGKIIKIILEPVELAAIRDHNKSIEQKEKEIGRLISGAGFWSYSFIPCLAVIGVMGMLAYSCAGGDHKKYASAMAHMQVGNYNIAKKELESIPGSDLEYIVKAMEISCFFPWL